MGKYGVKFGRCFLHVSWQVVWTSLSTCFPSKWTMLSLSLSVVVVVIVVIVTWTSLSLSLSLSMLLLSSQLHCRCQHVLFRQGEASDHEPVARHLEGGAGGALVPLAYFVGTFSHFFKRELVQEDGLPSIQAFFVYLFQITFSWNLHISNLFRLVQIGRAAHNPQLIKHIWRYLNIFKLKHILCSD